MAILSNVNGKFAVDSTGAIQFSGSAGTSGYILRSNGNAAPTWVDVSTIIGGPYLPIAGGVLEGTTSTDTGISFTVGGNLFVSGNSTFGGNVTINAPSTKFNTDGDSFFEILDAGTNACYLRAGASDEVYIGANNNYQLRLKTNKDVVMDNGGNFGIGTTSPAYQLTVSKNSGFHEAGLDTFQSSAGAAHQELRIISDAHGGGGRTGDITFYTANSATATEKMRIKETGAIEIKGSSTTASAQAYITNDNSLLTIGSSVSGSVVKDIQFSSPSAMMYIDGSTANVGIGTTSPNTKLHLKDSTTSSAVQIAFENDSRQWRFGVNGGYADDSINLYDLQANTVPFIVKGGTGNVGIGTDSPATSYGFSKTLEIQGAANAEINISQSNNGKDWSLGIVNGANYQQTTSGQDYIWVIGGSEKIRIRSGGNVHIGTGAGTLLSGGKLVSSFDGAVNNGILVENKATGTASQNMIVFTRNAAEVGSIASTNTTTTYVTSSSDKRLKKNINVWKENVLDKFKDIKPKQFHFNNQNNLEEKIKGYIAQNEVDKFPEAYPLKYHEESKEDRHQFNPSGMTVYLMKAIQELEARIKELENK